MILVIGNTPQRVAIKDLDDFVYYKQQKVYTDDQHNRSQDLQREIQKGSLTILRKTEDRNGSFDVPSVSFSNAPAQEKPTVVDLSKLEILLERLQSLEETIKVKPVAPAISVASTEEPSPDVVRALTEKILKLESDLSSSISNEQSLTTLHDAIRRLEERVNTGPTDALIKKIEDILSKAPMIVGSSAQEKEEIRPEDVYVPSVSVEDANTHIKLNVRTIDQSDDMSDTLKKLKELKSKST